MSTVRSHPNLNRNSGGATAHAGGYVCIRFLGIASGFSKEWGAARHSIQGRSLGEKIKRTSGSPVSFASSSVRSSPNSVLDLP